MTKEYATNLVEHAYYGIDENIPAEQTAVVNLRDLVRVHATLGELLRFFHQPLHMQSLDEVEEYLGTIDTNGAFKLLHLAYYEILGRMLPSEVDKLFDDGVFDDPQNPYYFQNNVED